MSGEPLSFTAGVTFIAHAVNLHDCTQHHAARIENCSYSGVESYSRRRFLLGMAARPRLATGRDPVSRYDPSRLPHRLGDCSVLTPRRRNHPAAAGALPLHPV